MKHSQLPEELRNAIPDGNDDMTEDELLELYLKEPRMAIEVQEMCEALYTNKQALDILEIAWEILMRCPPEKFNAPYCLILAQTGRTEELLNYLNEYKGGLDA